MTRDRTCRLEEHRPDGTPPRTFNILDIVTLRTVISPRGNWAFVYSDPQGRKVMGTSVVEGGFRREAT